MSLNNELAAAGELGLYPGLRRGSDREADMSSALLCLGPWGSSPSLCHPWKLELGRLRQDAPATP